MYTFFFSLICFVTFGGGFELASDLSNEKGKTEEKRSVEKNTDDSPLYQRPPPRLADYRKSKLTERILTRPTVSHTSQHRLSILISPYNKLFPFSLALPLSLSLCLSLALSLSHSPSPSPYLSLLSFHLVVLAPTESTTRVKNIIRTSYHGRHPLAFSVNQRLFRSRKKINKIMRSVRLPRTPCIHSDYNRKTPSRRNPPISSRYEGKKMIDRPDRIR